MPPVLALRLFPESGDEELHIASFSQKHGSDPNYWNGNLLLAD